MPWEHLDVSDEKKEIHTAYAKIMLKKLPVMDKNKWPDNIDFDTITKSFTVTWCRSLLG